ncbi:MAG: RloB family protein [Bacteroidales bacterium]|nr:RloB family protein [Bacteroidales bacterium]
MRGRAVKERKCSTAISVIVDGQDEKWYVEQVRSHYKDQSLRFIRVEPELPEKKKVKELFASAKEKLSSKVFKKVILIIDLDTILQDSKEFNEFKSLYQKWILDPLNGKKSKIENLEDFILIINNPCLEYWYLLHHKSTNKFYPSYAALLPDLRRCKSLENYEKSKEYYYGEPKLYQRLSHHLTCARSNSAPFSLELCQFQGGSTMGLLFDFLDTLATP